MDNICSVGIKFRSLDEVTLQEIEDRAVQIDRLASEYGRISRIRCNNGSQADVYYDFHDENRAIKFLTRASNLPGVSHCVYDNQGLF